MIIKAPGDDPWRPDPVKRYGPNPKSPRTGLPHIANNGPSVAAEAHIPRDKPHDLMADQQRQREEAAAAGRISNRAIGDDPDKLPLTDEYLIELLTRPTTDSLPAKPDEPVAERKGGRHAAPIINLAMENKLMVGSSPANTAMLNLAALHLLVEWRQASIDAVLSDAPTDALSDTEALEDEGVDAVNLVDRVQEEWTALYLKKLWEAGAPPSALGEPWNFDADNVKLLKKTELGRNVLSLQPGNVAMRQVGDVVFNEQGHLAGRMKASGKIDKARIRNRQPKGSIDILPDPPNLSSYDSTAIPRNTRRGRRQGEINVDFLADGISYPDYDDPPAFDPIALGNERDADYDKYSEALAKLANWRDILRLPHLYDAVDGAATGNRLHECAGKPIKDIVGKAPNKQDVATGRANVTTGILLIIQAGAPKT